MQRFASHLPPGFAYEWSGISREQIESGGAAALIFALGIVFVFLVLAAQYESFADPLIILLAVPLALLGAFLGITISGFFGRHLLSDVFAQVGYVMLIGLASKNAILIVEFANQLRASGVPIRGSRGARGRNAAAADPHDVDRVRPRRHAARVRDRAPAARRATRSAPWCSAA